MELINLSKKFIGGFTLGPINLKIEDNEILVMIGPTGSGKTTVLNLIAGLLRPDRGSITIDGLARMLVTKPKIMLMDEPLAHLDSPTKMKLRLDLRRVLKNQRVPTIYV